MIDSLVEEGKIRNLEVERAFRHVKRHHFLKGFVEPIDAYKDRAIMIKGNISSSSQPHVMAMMLEALELKKGLKVLEIGTASGYNAALMAEIVGQDELVYTIEIEADLAKRAARILREVGYPGVTVIAGDGRKGYPVAAPYDRIIVTAETRLIYPDWIEQLVDDGIILIPFNFFGAITVTVKLCLREDGKYRGPLVGFPVSFVPIRGVDVQESIDPEFLSCYHRLTQYLFGEGLDLNFQQTVGLVLLLITWYKKGKLNKSRDYNQLIELWKMADMPGIGDFEFEYDNTKEDWHLIPIF
ncbi:hypothetical protein BBF96_06970 [Anoxybacter fermentans]|uniref:Protein-L-isoaspartate O-methyltransferase n=1 Tax=Anoxybacter fermentans TaxID=1323375 RepID=A0A3S9SXS5_9FIRM|nr:methyltransferase domain-containing protein [Anoxybacter fermentans]AZR73146.1 hypothetical protein BBF96_06970 [Anoxybacter fermentans]